MRLIENNALGNLQFITFKTGLVTCMIWASPGHVNLALNNSKTINQNITQMKKIIVLAAMLTIVGSAAYPHAGATAYSAEDALAHRYSPDPASPAVQKSFNRSFAEATHIKWERIGRYYRANFILDGEWVYAYFAADGRELAVSRKLTQEQLPLNLWRLLHKKLENGSLVELFEVAIDGQTTYYTRINNSTHSILYRGSASGGWQVFKKTRHRR